MQVSQRVSWKSLLDLDQRRRRQLVEILPMLCVPCLLKLLTFLCLLLQNACLQIYKLFISYLKYEVVTKWLEDAEFPC